MSLRFQMKNRFTSSTGPKVSSSAEGTRSSPGSQTAAFHMDPDPPDSRRGQEVRLDYSILFLYYSDWSRDGQMTQPGQFGSPSFKQQQNINFWQKWVEK